MGQLIVGFDGSESAEVAVRWALARAARTGESVRLVESWRDPAFGVGPLAGAWTDLGAVERELAAALDEVIARLVAEHPGVTVTGAVVPAAPVGALLEASEAPGAVLVVGARGRGGFLGLGLGSVSAKLARQATAPVVVVRPTDAPADGPVVVGVDGRPSGRRALRFAAEQAASLGVPLLAVLAWSYLEPQELEGPADFAPDYDDERARAVLAGIVADELGADADGEPMVREVHQVVTCDLAPEAVLGAARDAQLVVVGATGSSGPGVFGVGSVSQQVLLHAPCPVAVVRPAAT